MSVYTESDSLEQSSIEELTRDNLRKRLDEFARRTDWNSCWIEEDEMGNISWFIKFIMVPSLVKTNKKRFTSLMGKHFTKWLEERPEKTILNREIVHRWSIPMDTRKRGNTKGWNVIYIVYTGVDQVKLGFTPGCYYGTSKTQGRDLSTRESGDWHEICFNSLDIDRFSGLQRQSNLTSCLQYANNNRVGAPKFSIMAPPKYKILDELDAYCSKHVGSIRQIGGIGARTRNGRLANFMKLPKIQVLMGGKTGCCATEALVNALDELKGRDFAEATMNNMPLFAGRDLGDLSKFLEHEVLYNHQRKEPGFNLLHVSKDLSWSKISADEAVRNILSLPSGIFIVHVKGSVAANHALVVNTMSRTIIDSKERYHLHLCKEALLLCCGREKLLSVEDVRCLVQKAGRKRSRGGISRRVRAKLVIMKRHGLLAPTALTRN